MGSLAGSSNDGFTVVAESSCGAGPAASSNVVDPTGPSSSYAASVLADHPSAYYRLVDPSGYLMADSSGNAADGQYGSGATLNQAAALPDDPDGSVAVSGSAAGSANPGLPEGNSARSRGLGQHHRTELLPGVPDRRQLRVNGPERELHRIGGGEHHRC